MTSLNIDGPVAVMEFEGDIKTLVANLPYVAAAWLDRERTLIAVKLEKTATSARCAEFLLSQAIHREPVKTHFSMNGLDVAFLPNGNN